MSTSTELENLQAEIRDAGQFAERAIAEIGRAVVGQRMMVDRLIIGLISGGHVLLEGVPGLAKTLTVKSLARVLEGTYQRIQFTPDLLPADLVGTLMFNQREGTFEPRKGPVFANIILADEINRAPAKVQSALLEAMQEQQVTIGDTTYPLPKPFLVMATQNPVEQEGTYPLPEAQVDRFMLKVKVGYPLRRDERQVLDLVTESDLPPGEDLKPIATLEDVLRARALVRKIYVDEKVKEYILDLVEATRDPERYGLDIGRYIQFGASPRATIFLALAAKAHAFIQRRAHVTPDDVKIIGMDVLRHRIIPNFEAEAMEVTSEDIVRKVFNEVPVP
jgi:MoxR-like ATPase